ncbi:MAG: flippase-like domain-containing protein [candidate division NC10 bacterium]|nr:flippase-like domain-containing protein [candidate division NC10 bacterium]
MAYSWKVRLILLVLGIALFTFLISQVGPSILFSHLRLLGWKLPILLLPYLMVYILDSVGWRYALGQRFSSIPLFTIFSIRMAGESLNYLTPMASLGGEPLKAYLLNRRGVPLPQGLASLVVAKTIMIMAHLLFIVIGLLMAIRPSGAEGPFIAASVAAMATGIPAIALFFSVQRRGLFSGLLKLTKAVRLKLPPLEKREADFRSLDRIIANFYLQDQWAFASSFTFFFIGWMVGSLEVYLLLTFLGMPVSLPTAVAIEALSTLAKAAAFFIPGSLGLQEGGNILAFLAFSLPSQAAMTFSLVRRGRELLWAGLGLLALAHYELRGWDSLRASGMILPGSEPKGHEDR